MKNQQPANTFTLSQLTALISKENKRLIEDSKEFSLIWEINSFLNEISKITVFTSEEELKKIINENVTRMLTVNQYLNSSRKIDELKREEMTYEYSKKYHTLPKRNSMSKHISDIIRKLTFLNF